ncbi:MAG: transcriptional repressor LexA [Bradymonadaceae bacterium]|nr:transcriptional repressor LexA [Lujinxingiaceae bacterium]
MEQPQKLTDRQALVLDAITEHIQGAGYPPTIREIGDRLGIRSTNGVNDHLKALERKGYILREDSKSRALRAVFCSDGRRFEGSPGAPITEELAAIEGILDIPVVGRIAAGAPIAAIEHTEEYVKIGESLLGRSDGLFSLRVRGDSMIDDGIHDGDYIFVRQQQNVRDGEIVAAMVDGEATVKRIYRENGRVRLQPANDALAPIYILESDARETAVLGRVVGVFRRI